MDWKSWKNSIFVIEFLWAFTLWSEHHLNKEQKMANIWGRKEKVVCCNSETERGGARKGPAGVGYSLQCIAAEIYEYRSGEMWGNFTAGIVCHSPRLSMWSLPPRRLFHLQLSHTHSFSHTHTHTLLPVLPKKTWCCGVPLPKSDRCSNRKTKNQRPMIPIIRCDTLLMSGFV